MLPHKMRYRTKRRATEIGLERRMSGQKNHWHDTIELESMVNANMCLGSGNVTSMHPELFNQKIVGLKFLSWLENVHTRWGWIDMRLPGFTISLRDPFYWENTFVPLWENSGTRTLAGTGNKHFHHIGKKYGYRPITSNNHVFPLSPWSTTKPFSSIFCQTLWFWSPRFWTGPFAPPNFLLWRYA